MAPGGGHVAPGRISPSQVSQEARKGLLPGADEDGVGVRRSLLRQGGDVQPAQRHEAALGAVVIGQRVSPVGVGDVDLDDDQVRGVVGPQHLDVVVHQFRLVVW